MFGHGFLQSGCGLTGGCGQSDAQIAAVFAYEERQNSRYGVGLSGSGSAGDDRGPLRRCQRRRYSLPIGGGRGCTRSVHEQRGQGLADLDGIGGRVGLRTHVEEIPNGALLQMVSVQIQQLTLIGVDQFQRPQRPIRAADHQWTDPQRSEHVVELGPRECARIDVRILVDGDVLQSSQIQAHRAGSHRAHRQSGGEQHVLRRFPGQGTEAQRNVYVGCRQHTHVVERT